MTMYDYYIKFGNLDSEWVDSWSIVGEVPIPFPDKGPPFPPLLSDAAVQLRYSRLFQALLTIMATGMHLDQAVLVMRRVINTGNEPQVVSVIRFKDVIIDVCYPATDAGGPRIYFAYDTIQMDMTSLAQTQTPMFSPRRLALRPGAFV
jgi:hypothetical protein